MAVDEKDLTTQFKEALEQKNERVIEQQKQVIKDKTAATRVGAEQTALNEQLLDDIEKSEDQVALLKRKILRRQVIFGVLTVLCAIVAIARFTAWVI